MNKKGYVDNPEGKNYFYLALIIGLILITFVLSMNFYYNKKNSTCYEMHKQECYSCHSKNLSYALCSGFCYEPEDIDFNTECIYHPKESCENVQRACNYDGY